MITGSSLLLEDSVPCRRPALGEDSSDLGSEEEYRLGLTLKVDCKYEAISEDPRSSLPRVHPPSAANFPAFSALHSYVGTHCPFP